MPQPYAAYQKTRAGLQVADGCRIPGPLQFDVKSCEASEDIPSTPQLELGKSLAQLAPSAEPKK
eukprot:3002306-Lingulodinium_polyedra.AAC.1